MSYTDAEINAQALNKVDAMEQYGGWRWRIRIAEGQETPEFITRVARAHAYGNGFPIPYGRGEEIPGLAAKIEELLRSRAKALPAAAQCGFCRSRPCKCW